MNNDQPSLDLFSAGSDSLRNIADTFEPARLRQARVLARKKKAELAAPVGVSAAAIGQYEAGIVKPRAEHIPMLAKALGVEPGFFAAGRPMLPMDTGSAHFRSLRSMRAADRDRALATAEQTWELAFALEKRVQFPEVNLPAVEEGASPSAAARLLRAHWGVVQGPLPHLVATMESNGIVVLVLKEGSIENVDAFSVEVSGRPIVISTPRRSNNVFTHRFTCAHEIGHLLLHHDARPGDPIQEREADEFAAAFLTPKAEIGAVLPSRLDLAELARLGRIWGVSIESLIRRMGELRLSSEASVRRAYQRLNSNPNLRADEPWIAYRGESPSLLRQALALCEQSGISIVDLAHELEWDPARIRELMGIEDTRPKLTIVQ
ncbi:ImmA/IrrE family metallo-endopeptidase [Rhodococcus spelaei]|uniref:ImmA/IrrE family metallo-endopeptidase n=1 Tax=Rhodococcus spelaei TaxID=2546320 RepID=A0A541AZ17_9NOCA|nr:XRE family transcriptional regulator [Rhodococcus spelaei]TQF65311.1 ImmA/IrrE family metallo-endopeptidase [Rhodococcus spelaei]